LRIELFAHASGLPEGLLRQLQLLRCTDAVGVVWRDQMAPERTSTFSFQSSFGRLVNCSADGA